MFIWGLSLNLKLLVISLNICFQHELSLFNPLTNLHTISKTLITNDGGGFSLPIFSHWYHFRTPKMISQASKSNPPYNSQVICTLSTIFMCVHNIVQDNRELPYPSLISSSYLRINPEWPQVMIPGWDNLLTPLSIQGSLRSGWW